MDKVYCHTEYKRVQTSTNKILAKFNSGDFCTASTLKYVDGNRHSWDNGYFDLYPNKEQEGDIDGVIRISVNIKEFKKYFWTLEELREVKLNEILNT